MKIYLAAMLVTLFITGCNAIDDMKGMFEKQELAQSIIKEKYGWESQLGFNMHNAVLTQVTITFNAKEVGDQSVSDLETITKEVVALTFKSKPRAIQIHIAVPPGE